MKILFIGDIFGRAGRRAVTKLLPGLVARESIGFVIANVENAAGGKGFTPEICEEMFAAGVDVLTGGNHSFGNKDGIKSLEKDRRVLRPANYPEGEGVPGWGHGDYGSKEGPTVGVVNIMGRVHVQNMECPFRRGQALVAELKRKTDIVIVDFHAEATSEKVAMGWHLDGKATAVLGTHTHIQTADERVLPGGTAYITDVGMSGPYDSVIGVQKEIALRAMISLMHQRFEPAEGDARLCAVVIDVDTINGKARSIKRVMESAD